MAEVKYLTGTHEYKIYLKPLEYKLILTLLSSISVFETEEEKLFRHDLLDNFAHPEKF